MKRYFMNIDQGFKGEWQATLEVILHFEGAKDQFLIRYINNRNQYKKVFILS